MKKIILTILFIIISNSTINSQDFFIETKFQLPGENYIFGVGLTTGYYFDVIDNLRIGPSIGGDFYLSDKDTSAENTLFMPLSISTDYKFDDEISIGLDIGYAFGVSPSNAKGGFYYRPIFKYDIFTASYSTINLGSSNSFNAFQVGIKVDSGRYKI